MTFFRIFPPVLEDLGKTVIRIEQQQMDSLGIVSGDAVRVSWQKSTGAFCFPIQNGYKQPNDPKMTYLYDAQVLPQVRLSDIVMMNTGNSGNHPTQVKIEKVDCISAQRVTLGSLDPEANLKQLDVSKLYGLMMCNNNRLNLVDTHRQPRSLVVLDVQPRDFAIITRDTKIDFVNVIPPEKLPPICFSKLQNLMRVIPVSTQIQKESVNVTIPSLEIYDDGFRAYVYMRGKWEPGDSESYHPMSGLPTLVRDNLGNSYEIFPSGSGGSGGPYEFDYNWQIRGPPINPDAKELIITIKEIIFQGMFFAPPTKPPHMTEFRYSLENQLPPIQIISGPWEFKIKLV